MDLMNDLNMLASLTGSELSFRRPVLDLTRTAKPGQATSLTELQDFVRSGKSSRDLNRKGCDRYWIALRARAMVTTDAICASVCPLRFVCPSHFFGPNRIPKRTDLRGQVTMIP